MPDGSAPVTDDSDRSSIILTNEIVSGFQAERRRHAATGVARHEKVVLGLVRIRVAHQAAASSKPVEMFVPTCHEFVRVDLMTRVPDQAILREVVSKVQRDAQLDNAEIAGEVCGTVFDNRTQNFADLSRELHELFRLVILNVFCRFNLREQFKLHQ